MLVPTESSSAVIVMMSSKSVSICNRFHARWANSGKITISKGGTPLWCPRSRGISSPSGTKLPPKKLETLGYHMVQTRSLYLTWPWIRTGSCRTDRQTCAWYTTGSWQTDGQTDVQTDRIPIANTRSQQYLPVQLWRVKMISRVCADTVWPSDCSRTFTRCMCEYCRQATAIYARQCRWTWRSR